MISQQRFCDTINGHDELEGPVTARLHQSLRKAFGGGVRDITTEGTTEHFTTTLTFTPESPRNHEVRDPVSITKQGETVTIEGLRGTAAHAVQALVEQAIKQHS